MNIQQSTAHGRAAGQPSSGQDAEHASRGQPADVPHLASSKILGAGGEAVIEHDGHLYRLRRTSRGGLVLTK
jgi:hemin uptake protein HemP